MWIEMNKELSYENIFFAFFGVLLAAICEPVNTVWTHARPRYCV